MVEDLLAEVEAARASLAEHERHHERVKELMIEARLKDRKKFGPKVLEQMTDAYLDRATISRFTAKALADQKPETDS